MANISAIQKVSRVITLAELRTDFYMAVRLVWPSSFFDTNYVIAATLEVPNDVPGISDATLVVTDVTPDGFTALIANDGPADKAGMVTIHAMASHL